MRTIIIEAFRASTDFPPPPPPPPLLKRSMKKLIAVVLIVTIAISAIGAYVLLGHVGSNPGDVSNLNPTTNPSGTNPSKTPSATNAATGNALIKYKTEKYVDTQGIGTTAFSLLVPSDWQFEANINWVLDNPSMPATASIRAWNPNGPEQFEGFPNQAFFWTDNPLVQYTNPSGSLYFGALVQQPLGVIDALKQIALPLFRGNEQNLQIVSEQTIPEMDKLFTTGTDPSSGLSFSVESGKIRIEYTLSGVQMEDEIYCVIQHLKIPVGAYTNDNWFMSYMASFRAEKGQLDQESKTFQTIAFSTTVDKNWLNKYNQLVYYLIQNQIKQIQSIGQLSNILAQTSDEISDSNLKDWEQRQSVNDQIATDFCNQILEIQPYNNPIDGTTVDLPSGYSSVWTNSLGEYVLGDSPSFNPNIGSNMDWQPMTATK
jgi:hypothetical protein